MRAHQSGKFFGLGFPVALYRSALPGDENLVTRPEGVLADCRSGIARTKTRETTRRVAAFAFVTSV